MLTTSDNLTEAILKELPDAEQAQYRMVFDAINNNQLLTDQLRADNGGDASRTFGERMSDLVASFGGSWAFIGTFLFCMAVWMGINIYVMSNRGFDPYPFILLNLVLSCVAALQAPIIMMSQNRKDQRDRQRAQDDYLINLKAEIEIRHLSQKLEQVEDTQNLIRNSVEAETKELLASLQEDVSSLQASIQDVCLHLGVQTNSKP